MSMGLASRNLTETLSEQDWLEPIDAALGGAITWLFETAGPAGQVVKDFLHGTWLGHPLHPAVSDIPIGAWTTAVVLDALATTGGREDLRPGADAAVALGLVGATGAALAGLTDWNASGGPARKLGLVHGMLNIGAAGIYAASLACRLQGARKAGVGLSLLGFALVNYSALLGGDLVYGERLGVVHSDEGGAPKDFVAVLEDAELPEGALVQGRAGTIDVVLARVRGRVYCLDNRCSHLGCALAEGTLDGDTIVCGCHGSAFALEDGRVIHGPATRPQPYLEVRVRDGRVEARSAAS